MLPQNESSAQHQRHVTMPLYKMHARPLFAQLIVIKLNIVKRFLRSDELTGYISRPITDQVVFLGVSMVTTSHHSTLGRL
jgi:hypothetical protein